MDISTRPHGLLYCTFADGDSSFCILKAIELAISALIAIFAALEIYFQLRLFGLRVHWKTAALFFILVSLILDICFCLWNSTYELYSLESYLNSLYFLTIVGDVCRLYIRKNSWNGPCARYGFFAAMAAMAVLYTLILIDALITENSQAQNINCEQIWYLCVNVICLCLCIVALVVLHLNQREEKNRLLKYDYDKGKVSNPLTQLWIWIGINTVAQVIDLVETGLLIHATPDNHCMIVEGSETSNNLLMFAFAVLTLDLGYVATLWYFGWLRRRTEFQERLPSQNFSEEITVGAGLEMFGSLADL